MSRRKALVGGGERGRGPSGAQDPSAQSQSSGGKRCQEPGQTWGGGLGDAQENQNLELPQEGPELHPEGASVEAVPRPPRTRGGLLAGASEEIARTMHPRPGPAQAQAPARRTWAEPRGCQSNALLLPAWLLPHHIHKSQRLSKPLLSASHTHYLFNPFTQNVCKANTSLTPILQVGKPRLRNMKGLAEIRPTPPCDP